MANNGKELMPLENQHKPWLHLSLDFLTDLTELEGNTVILVTMDGFLRFLKLILLPALPTALKTAEIIFNHLFRYYGLPEDTVSERGHI